MPKKKTPLIRMAICYDFDGTLSPRNMQEYGFIKRLGLDPDHFWKKSNGLAVENQADPILAYMKLMIEESKAAGQPFRKKDFVDDGKTVRFYPGVVEWFKRISTYALERGVQLDHYIISSGLQEMIEGTKIASNFKRIFASRFMYDQKGVAVWPAIGLNYTTKTQFLYRINKGCEDISDNVGVNKFVEFEDRPVPFTHMIFLGDGETDIPCMRMLRSLGGYAVAVYRPKNAKSEKMAEKLINEERVNIAALADYRPNKDIDVFVRTVINKIVADAHLSSEIKKLNQVKK